MVVRDHSTNSLKAIIPYKRGVMAFLQPAAKYSVKPAL
ncbi:hypothetical protein NC99_29520 [Sunxiuqinia dokdonensis]|uniref:Uncharacterized protein n=1 Tax=Sunxiuqinia dokdonensis TaxID=1409788 RepID=A0A0L8V718_9BACT|nr:hypothetical protein NC99_29520 [Sunxiuqinia dokdonensis]